MQRAANFAPHKITIAPNKMKQRGEVAGKLPAVLRLSEKEEAAPSGTQGWRNAEAQRRGQAACGGDAKRGAWEERWRTAPRGEDSSSPHRGLQVKSRASWSQPNKHQDLSKDIIEVTPNTFVKKWAPTEVH